MREDRTEGATVKKFNDVIERIEYLRNFIGLNKSRFSSEIGMKPQTYNNFIGSQGSKPNIELISGIVNTFGVNPKWLLNGNGPIFDEELRPQSREKPTGYKEGAGIQYGHVREEMTRLSQNLDQDELENLQSELKSLEPRLLSLESHLRNMERVHLPLHEQVISFFRKFYEVEPLVALAEFKITLERIEKHIENKSKSSKK